MDFKEIKELIKIIDESNLTTLKVEKEGFKIVLEKKPEQSVSREKTETLSSGQAPAESRPAYKTIDSPMVGTFYASSSPGGEPFVVPGAKVKKGSTLCIIEAMKLMNEIEAEEDMQILEVLVNDGEMVEYGQPLFVIDK
jgi:acetyl-CoA carboxylase biotin carboxyl carrier protein